MASATVPTAASGEILLAGDGRGSSRPRPAPAAGDTALGAATGPATGAAPGGATGAATGATPGAATGATPGAATGEASGLITRRFSISGSVAGLYPGVTFPLVLTVTNPLKVTITVTSITTAVSNASPSCLSGNVTVSTFQGSLPIAAGASVHTTVTAAMAHAAPNACQGKVFPFHYLGVATAA